MTVKLSLSQVAFERLWETADKTRRGTRRVPVETAALSALLIDHGRVLAVLKDANIKVEEP